MPVSLFVLPVEPESPDQFEERLVAPMRWIEAFSNFDHPISKLRPRNNAELKSIQDRGNMLTMRIVARTAMLNKSSNLAYTTMWDSCISAILMKGMSR
jgi:hypothetical protein